MKHAAMTVASSKSPLTSPANKVIGAICHGTQVLAAVGVVGGRSCSCYPPLSFDLLLAVARFVDIPMDEAH